ncbi:ubiquitin-like protein, partial [Cadophora sp. DSE1049]
GAPAVEDKKAEKAGVINIKVKDQNEGETFFKIKGHTKLGKVFDTYCDRQSLARNTVRFLFEGARIQDTDTPDSLEMQDGDMVQAMLEQVGG